MSCAIQCYSVWCIPAGFFPAQNLCTNLKLGVDDDVAELEIDVSRYQATDDGEVHIPLGSRSAGV